MAGVTSRQSAVDSRQSGEPRAANLRPPFEAVVLVLRPRAADALLRGERRRSVAGAGGVAAGHKTRVRRHRRAAGHPQRSAVCDFLLLPWHSHRGVGGPVEPAQRAGVVVRAVERGDGRVRHGGELRDAVRRARVHGHRRGRRQPAVALAHLGLLPEAQARDRVFDLRAGRADRDLDRRRRRRLGHAAPRVARDVLPCRVPGRSSSRCWCG